jgi:hypothetical protein
MAIFQFTVALIPSKWAHDSNNDIESLYYEAGYDVSVAWKDNQPNIDVDSLISKVLPKGKAWDSEQKVWGSDESSDIQVWYENGRIESIDVRLDLREDISSLLSKVVELAKRLKCYLFIPGAKSIIEPNVFELKKAANESNAAKFVEDPEGFLRNVENE